MAQNSSGKNSALKDVEQPEITLQTIQEALVSTPRRMKLMVDWPTVLHEPSDIGKDWSIVLPFPETYANTFRAGCRVRHIGLRRGSQGRCYTFLPTAKEDPSVVERVLAWTKSVGGFVAIRDCLAASFALDYDRERGDPNLAHSPIGDLRVRAKPYDQAPTKDTYRAATELVDELSGFLASVELYQMVDAIVAVPPSNPNKDFNLSVFLAERLAANCSKQSFGKHVRTISLRKALKSEAIADKLSAISGTIAVSPRIFDGQTVLVVDDLYQSGVSMNYVGMLLLRAGASRVLGLACVKTCRNDDNVGGRI